MTDEEKVDRMRRALGLEPKTAVVSVPAVLFCDLIDLLGYQRGLMAGTALAMYNAGAVDWSSQLLVEHDNLETKLRRLVADLWR